MAIATNHNFPTSREVDYRHGARMMTVIFVPGSAVVYHVLPRRVEAASVVHVLQSGCVVLVL